MRLAEDLKQHGAEILPLGQDGVIVRFGVTNDPRHLHAALAFRQSVIADLPAGVIETASSLVSVYLRFDPGQTDRAKLTSELSELLGGKDWSDARAHGPTRRWHVPVAIGGASGPRLAALAGEMGLSEQAAAQEFLATELSALTIGFAPGMAYLGLLPERWNIPRMAALAPKVEAGALVVSVRQAIVFSKDTPTGWHQIGRTAFRPFLPTRQRPFLLRPGDAVRFELIDEATLAAREADNADGLGGARCEAL